VSSLLFFRKNQNLGREIFLSEEEIKHLKSLRILKAKKPFEIEFRDGKGLSVKYLFESEKLSGREIERREFPLENEELSVLMAIPKPGKLEFWLQKGTELGITKFYFTVFQYSERKELNFNRCFRVISEACAQSKRISIPEIQLFSNLEEVFSVLGQTNFIYLHPYSHNVLDLSNYNISSCLPIIGPEAGFHDLEISYFSKKNIPSFSLGKNILRMETAAIAITSILKYERSKLNG